MIAVGNSGSSWGWVAIALHWLSALLVFAMFGLGVWMVELGYYHPWYHRGPDLHRSVGVVLFALTLLRLLWRWRNVVPLPLPNHTAWERLLAGVVHDTLYILMFLVMVSGYFITTAKGGAVPVFGLFELPALFSGFDLQADIAGAIHRLAAWGLILLALGHGAAALKHHLIDRDRTLLRMVGAP